MNVRKLAIEPAYKKENGAFAIDTQSVLPNDAFHVIEQFIISLPAGEVAGNHRHARKEALLGLGEALYFLWQDGDNVIHEEAMNPEGHLYLFLIPSNVPHAVANKSPNKPAVLYEYFDDVYSSVERVNITG